MKNGDKTSFMGYLVVFFLAFSLGFLGLEIAWAAEPKKTASSSQVAKELQLEFVLIQPGTFDMGAEPKLERLTSYALPKHEVTISQPFYLGKYEVTQRQWMKVMDLNPSKFKAPNNPVDSVSWEKAQEFIAKLNQKEGRQIFRLPTEAEWEYAARAGDSSVYTFGDLPHNLGDYSWHTNNSGLVTHPVGQKRPNRWGLYDLLGNVREWTSDWMGPYLKEKVVDPKGPEEGSVKVARGGAFNFIDINCAVSRRVGYAPNSRQTFLGFRLVMDLDEKKPLEPEEAAPKPAEPKPAENVASEEKAAESLPSQEGAQPGESLERGNGQSTDEPLAKTEN